jgi:hypothetical protein
MEEIVQADVHEDILVKWSGPSVWHKETSDKSQEGTIGRVNGVEG